MSKWGHMCNNMTIILFINRNNQVLISWDISDKFLRVKEVSHMRPHCGRVWDVSFSLRNEWDMSHLINIRLFLFLSLGTVQVALFVLYNTLEFQTSISILCRPCHQVESIYKTYQRNKTQRNKTYQRNKTLQIKGT